MADAKSQAETLITEAKVQAEEMLSDNEIMQQAYAKANALVQDAQNQADIIVNNAVADADQILLIKDGCLVAHGTHDDLLNHSTAYSDMWQAFLMSERWFAGREEHV